MEDKIKSIMNIMEEIEYGFPDKDGTNIINNKTRWNNDFYNFYYLLSPTELLKYKYGVCWDQVELERELFNKENINISTYFICTYDNDKLPSHTFLTYESNNKYYWFEHSWNDYKGIHEYNTLKELLIDVKQKFIKSNTFITNNDYTFIYKYNKPKSHLTCEEFYKYVETQELIKTNKPLYFYHLVNKNSDLSKGLLSLQYMYDHKLYNLFDKNVSKYKDRITNYWNIDKYKGKSFLTREEYLDGLKQFRGEHGSSYIYFFRYPPIKKLGPRMEEILKTKDIYRININDEEIMLSIKDIFYGFDMSNSDNKILNKEYYENISKEDYFKYYDDSIKMNFSKLNHIGIAFIDDYCHLDFLEKVGE